MEFVIRYEEGKNQILKKVRGIGFDDILLGKFLDEVPHPSKTNQMIWFFYFEGYVHLVPCVYNERKREIFLKTLYPSRKYTKLYKTRGKV
jgi:hypothetical protein